MREIYQSEAQLIVSIIAKARAQAGYSTLTDGEKSAVLGALFAIALRDHDAPGLAGAGQATPAKI